MIPEKRWLKGNLNELWNDPWKKLTKGEIELKWEKDDIERDEMIETDKNKKRKIEMGYFSLNHAFR